MNLLIVISHLRRGGPVDVVYNLCRWLVEQEAAVTLLTLRPEGPNSKIEEFRALGLAIESLEATYASCELGVGRISARVAEVVQQRKIDLVHCHGYHPVLACAPLRGVKRIATLHNRANEDYLNAFGPLWGRYMLHRYLKALRRLDGNVAVSASGAELYRNLHLPAVCCVNNGIDTDRFRPATMERRAALRRELGLPPDAEVLISSGRIEPEKRCEELVDWFHHTDPHSHRILLLLGDGSRLARCREVTQGDDRIRYVGRVNNVCDYLQAADLYISYSKSEGMSMAVCEGIACGLYPLLSDIPSHRDAAEGVEGTLFRHPEAIDWEQVALRRSSPEVLHNHIEAHFSIRTMCEGYWRLYKKLANE